MGIFFAYFDNVNLYNFYVYATKPKSDLITKTWFYKIFIKGEGDHGKKNELG